MISMAIGVEQQMADLMSNRSSQKEAEVDCGAARNGCHEIDKDCRQKRRACLEVHQREAHRHKPFALGLIRRLEAQRQFISAKRLAAR
jgi:hypothetical protein